MCVWLVTLLIFFSLVFFFVVCLDNETQIVKGGVVRKEGCVPVALIYILGTTTRTRLQRWDRLCDDLSLNRIYTTRFLMREENERTFVFQTKAINEKFESWGGSWGCVTLPYTKNRRRCQVVGNERDAKLMTSVKRGSKKQQTCRGLLSLQLSFQSDDDNDFIEGGLDAAE